MPDRSVRSVIEGQDVLIASVKTTVSDAALLMKRGKVGAIIVVEGTRLVGIFTERDAVFRVLAENRDPHKTKLGDVMTADPRTIAPDRPLGHALHLMFDGGYRHVPVVEHGRPVGMVSARDALGPELAAFQDELVQREHIREIL